MISKAPEFRGPVINLTGEPFCCYGWDGTPVSFLAETLSDGTPKLDYGDDQILVVNEELYQMLRENGCSTHILAKLDEPSEGIGGLIMRRIIERGTNRRIMPTNGTEYRFANCPG